MISMQSLIADPQVESGEATGVALWPGGATKVSIPGMRF